MSEDEESSRVTIPERGAAAGFTRGAFCVASTHESVRAASTHRVRTEASQTSRPFTSQGSVQRSTHPPRRTDVRSVTHPADPDPSSSPLPPLCRGYNEISEACENLHGICHRGYCNTTMPSFLHSPSLTSHCGPISLCLPLKNVFICVKKREQWDLHCYKYGGSHSSEELHSSPRTHCSRHIAAGAVDPEAPQTISPEPCA